jgi:hypothetical protein
VNLIINPPILFLSQYFTDAYFQTPLPTPLRFFRSWGFLKHRNDLTFYAQNIIDSTDSDGEIRHCRGLEY